MPDVLTYTGRLVIEHCCACGIAFGIPEDMQQQRLRDHKDFYCPAGHCQHYTGETAEQKLRRQLKNARDHSTWLSSRVDQETARADHESARRRGYQSALSRTKKRIGKGVCPACNRHFPDVEAHMAGQHPDYCEGATDA